MINYRQLRDGNAGLSAIRSHLAGDLRGTVGNRGELDCINCMNGMNNMNSMRIWTVWNCMGYQSPKSVQNHKTGWSQHNIAG